MWLVSVIVPLYNAEKYIERCIVSILSQSYIYFELLLIDDGSCDCSAQICDDYALKDKRIHVFHQPNLGVSAARNRGLMEAKGEYIVFVDIDDYIESKCLELLMRYRKYDIVCLSFAAASWEMAFLDEEYVKEDVRIGLQKYIYSSGLITVWGKLLRKSIICEYNLLFNSHISSGEDTLWLNNYLSHINSIKFSSYLGYYYSADDDNSSLSSKGLSFDSVEYTLILLLESYEKLEEKWGLDINYCYYRMLSVFFDKYVIYISRESLFSIWRNWKKVLIRYWVKQLIIDSKYVIKGKKNILFDWFAIHRMYLLLSIYVKIIKKNICSMIKCGFYIENKGIESVDCTNLRNGNPGIGGTEYAILLVTDWLSKEKKDISLTLYARSNRNLPDSINVNVCNSITDALMKSIDNGDEIFVLRFELSYLQRRILDNPLCKKIKIILWAHNFYRRKYLSYFDSLSFVKAIVNVGREQLDAYRDHHAFYKSTYIYNGVYIENNELVRKFDARPNEVTYIGGLYPGKGVHYLTQIWRDVLAEIPDAKLNIIGSGKLYSRDCRLGKFGIAESSYEGYLLKPVIDVDGNIIPSVRFLGVLGEEKKYILENTKVGIPNPGGIGETFGYTAVEMQLAGCLVTTIKGCGYMDSVYRKDMLYTDIKKLGDKIISLLKCDTNDIREVREFVKTNFSMEVVGEKWYDLLCDIHIGRTIVHENELTNKKFNLKWLREINRKVKLQFPFLPSIALYQYCYYYYIKERILGRFIAKYSLPVDYDRL